MDRITRFVHPALFLLFVAILLIPTHTTHAAAFTAGNATELINAINTANGNGEADTIGLTADITLTAVDNTTDGPTGLPSITSVITIEGAGFTIARGGGAPDFRIFHVAAGGDLTLNNVTVSNGNANNLSWAMGNEGGGIFNRGAVTVNNSTLTVNSALYGGGISARGGWTEIYNSTISGNSARFLGGGIHGLNWTEIYNSTISGNSAFSGGGIWIWGTATLNNSIVANSTGGDCILGSGTFAGANNLAADDCAAISLGTVSNLDPVLADNGGPTWTHALLAGSNAINASGAGATANDQRGLPAVGVRDIGAYEYVWVLPQLSFAVNTPAIFENATAGPTIATVTATLDNTAGNLVADTVTVDFALAGTATEGPTVADDYQQGGTLPLTFTGATWPAPGAVATQSFTLTAWDDATAEALETIDMTMSFTGPATLVGANSSTVGIIDDETALPPAPPTCPGCTGGDVTIVGETEYIEKTVDNPMATGGQTVTYTITARNPKDVPLTQVVIYDVFDDLLENVQVISTTHGHAVLRGDTVTVSGFTLQPGEAATVVVSAQITASFRAGDVIPNIAALESPDASVHVSNLVLVGDNCLNNDGEAVTLLVIPGQLPATGETSARDWRQALAP